MITKAVMPNNKRTIQILNDFVIGEEICNLSCDYCLTEDAKLKKKHDFKRTDGKLNFQLEKIKDYKYLDGYKIKSDINNALDAYAENFDSPILKISGGEVLLLENIIDLIKKESKRYEVVQILTNGVLLEKDFVMELKKIPNINIQFSLDGHLYEMNSYRMKSANQHQKLMGNLDRLVESGITTEIYSVLNTRNIGNFNEFAEFLHSRYNDKVYLTFFPVRHSAAKKHFPNASIMGGFDKLIEAYDRHASFLPPIEYLKEIKEYITKTKRYQRCYVPLIMFQNFDDGVVTPCPNCWTVQIGNLRDNPQVVKDNIGQHQIYKLMTAQPPLAPFCLKCYTDYHLFNLYFSNTLKLEDIIKTRPLLQGPKTQARLVELKKMLENVHHQCVEN